MSSLNDLKAVGAFVVDELVKKDIKFKLDDEEHEFQIFVRRLSIGLQEEIFMSGGDSDKSRTAKMISEAVRLGETGEERMSFQDAYKLHPVIAVAMSKAIGEVNRSSGRKN